ncbi:DNA topoisomerase 3 [Thauera mechernichensis]
MRLYIAEKPSLGKAIAENLPGVKSRDDGFIRVGTDVVTWAHGHILELAPPEAYNPAWKSWNTAVNVLPYPIECFKLLPKPDSKAQLGVIQSLLSQATEVVNAGDPDREGQMLIDEILEFERVEGADVAPADQRNRPGNREEGVELDAAELGVLQSLPGSKMSVRGRLDHRHEPDRCRD